MRLISIQDVENGVEHTRTTADQHVLVLAAEEHQRTTMPLRKKAASLSSSSAAARAGIEETTRTLQGLETRLRLFEDHQRTTATDIAAAEREHATFTSRLGGQRGFQRTPAPANPATFVAPAAQQPLAPANLATPVAPAARQPPASANLATSVAPAARQPALAHLATLVAPPIRSLWSGTPPRSPPLPLRRDLSAPPPLPQPGPRLRYPLPSLFRLGQSCPRRPPENPQPPHPDRSWFRGHTGSLSPNRLPRPEMIPTWSSASRSSCSKTSTSHPTSGSPLKSLRRMCTLPSINSTGADAGFATPWI